MRDGGVGVVVWDGGVDEGCWVRVVNNIQRRKILKLNHRIASWTTYNQRRQQRPHHTLRNRRLKVDRNGEEAFVLAEYHLFAGGGC